MSIVIEDLAVSDLGVDNLKANVYKIGNYYYSWGYLAPSW